MEFQVLAEGLGFPEGPIVMPDGSVVLVEIKRQTLSRVWNGKTEVVAQLGGGPNGAALGPDGAVYVCNNGGFEWSELGGMTIPGHAAHDYTTGRIERVELATGKFERLYDKVNGFKLSGPNDLVFDRQGGFYFTDLGKSYPRTRDQSGLYYAKPDGSSVTELSYGGIGYNGVGLSPDEKTVYAAETLTGRLFAWEITAPGQVAQVGLFPAPVYVSTTPVLFDSLAVQANGDVCVASILAGGITTIRPHEGATHTPFPDLLVTNICFGGKDMRDAYITLSGTGKLVKARWPQPGLKLNFASY
jgi:gluconolactonase